jgi:hypothetical protein
VGWRGGLDGIRDAALAATIAAIALSPVAAFASVSSSPSLAQTLAPAPGGFTEVDPTTGILQGAFTADEYVAVSATGQRQTEVLNTLRNDGFVNGFAHTWVNRGTGQLMLEAVMAFGGGQGAAKWRQSTDVADKGAINYQRPLSLSGVPNSSGSHFAGSDFFADSFDMVKGNDFFMIIALSQKDDVTGLAAAQARNQYQLAPKYTIPPAQWPESHTAAYYLGKATIYGMFVLGAAGVVLTLVGIYLVWRRRTPAPPGSVQMTDDNVPESRRRLPPAAG